MKRGVFITLKGESIGNEGPLGDSGIDKMGDVMTHHLQNLILNAFPPPTLFQKYNVGRGFQSCLYAFFQQQKVGLI